MEKKIFTFFLPDLGEGVVEGEVIEWLKKVNDKVLKDEPVVIVMTDKATVELPSPYAGILTKHYYQAGEIAIKDKPLYDINLEDSETEISEVKSRDDQPKDNLKTEKSLPTIQGRVEGKAKAIPKVRHEAKEWDIDLEAIPGTGPEGRVEEGDIHIFLSKDEKDNSREPLLRSEEKQLTGIRRVMSRKMSETYIPQFSYFEQTDVTRLIQLRQKIKIKASEEGINLSYMPFFIRALSLTIKRYSLINASLDMQADKVLYHKSHNIGIAMATAQGLIVPVIKNVEEKGLTEIIQSYEDLKGRVLKGKISSNEMKETTITLSNFGVLGGEGMWATPMISTPQVAILALARIRKAPLVKNEELVVREILPLSWSFDHRLIDGELAAQISHYYSMLLKDPAMLL